MSDDRILTLHPQGKQGVNILRSRYEAARDALLASLPDGDELTHGELMAGVREQLDGRFDGSIGWYAETVKLDLEARGVIERVQGRPQRYRRS